METKLHKAFNEFLIDLKNVTKQQFRSNHTYDELKNELEKTKDVEIGSLHFFDIPVGKLYQSSGAHSKQAIEKHVEFLRSFLNNENDTIPLNVLPIANILNSSSLGDIAELVSAHKESGSVVDILRKVVNSPEFDKIALDLTKNFSR
jgi:hypothetical protein